MVFFSPFWSLPTFLRIEPCPVIRPHTFPPCTSDEMRVALLCLLALVAVAGVQAQNCNVQVRVDRYEARGTENSAFFTDIIPVLRLLDG
jgi:hypothetical protein